MAKTKTEWTEETWNPVRGCSRISEGCRNCYAEVMAGRFSDEGRWGHGFAERTAAGARWTGKVELIPEKLAEPLSWRKPRMVFVNSTSDLFHESLPYEHIAAVYGVMASCQHVTFQVLTKRVARARRFEAWLRTDGKRWWQVQEKQPSGAVAWWANRGGALTGGETDRASIQPWPLPNVWLGTSCERQEEADERIPHLLACPATVRFLSLEPLLGPVDLGRFLPCCSSKGCDERAGAALVSWVIVGGESGHGARPMHPAWVRSIRDQCVEAGVPFFFKQWGAFGSRTMSMTTGDPMDPREFQTFEQWVSKAATWIRGGICLDTRGRILHNGGDMMRARDEGAFPVSVLYPMNKTAAGRRLDGRTWDEMPEVLHG